MTLATLSIPNGAHPYDSTGTGNLLFSYQKPGPPPGAFPGRFTVPAFPLLRHRLTHPGLGQPGLCSLTLGHRACDQQSWAGA